MKVITLQNRNGIDPGVIGLGKEFDQLEESLSGINDVEGIGYEKFKEALHNHVRNTRLKIARTPNAVTTIYDHEKLGQMYGELDNALYLDDSTLMGVIEILSKTEHLAIKPKFKSSANAIHLNDDYLYGSVFGEIDENMLATFSGLGRKGRFKSRINKANSSFISGPFTKIKNALKKARFVSKGEKKGNKKPKKILKKIGQKLVKYNPVSISARLAFLTAMRTNFGLLAEKMYWAVQGKDFTLSKGIGIDYYNKSVELYNRAKRIFMNTLKGDESAFRKAILNGRAAKKIALQLKRKGISGIGELMSLPINGLSNVDPNTITAALKLLKPLLDLAIKMFKGISTSLQNENGTKSDSYSKNSYENMRRTSDEADNPSETINEDDDSEYYADEANEREPVEESY